MRYLIFGLAAVLLIGHQDFWLWDDRTLYFGFIPSGLAYHGVFTLLSALLGYLAVTYAWPEHLEADEPGEEA